MANPLQLPSGYRRIRSRPSIEDRMRIKDTGYIYFIRAGRTNRVKIGFAIQPEGRLRELQTASPHDLHLIGYLPGSIFDESEWHRKFSNDRVRGEWFTLTQRLRSTINELAVMDCGFVQYLHLSLLTRNAK